MSQLVLCVVGASVGVLYILAIVYGIVKWAKTAACFQLEVEKIERLYSFLQLLSLKKEVAKILRVQESCLRMIVYNKKKFDIDFSNEHKARIEVRNRANEALRHYSCFNRFLSKIFKGYKDKLINILSSIDEMEKITK